MAKFILRKRILLVAAFVPLCIGSIYLLNFIDPLEKIPMGWIEFEKGEELHKVCLKIEGQLKKNGQTWTVSSDAKICNVLATRPCRMNGSAILIPTISDYFNCRCVVLKNDRMILFY